MQGLDWATGSTDFQLHLGTILASQVVVKPTTHEIATASQRMRKKLKKCSYVLLILSLPS